MPTWSRRKSTTHSAKIRRRWSANWAMWSYSSCAKLHQKYNVLTVFFIEIKELCTALADNAWLTANPEENVTNYNWMHSLSRSMWWRKDSTRQNQRTNRVPHGLECVEEMLQESWLPRWTFYRYSRSISQRSNLSWITTRNRMDRTKVQRVGWTCKRRPYISSHSRGKEKQAKKCLWNFDLISEPLSWWKIVYTTNQENKLNSVSIQINKDDGIHLQAHRGGTSLNGIGSELTIFLIAWISFCYSWFRLQSIAIHCNRL